MKQLLGVVEREGKSYWTRIGVAFENKDGSFNLLFDYFPRNHEATIQLRDMPDKEGDTSPKGNASGTRGGGRDKRK